jgi:hypothetical protein
VAWENAAFEKAAFLTAKNPETRPRAPELNLGWARRKPLHFRGRF